MTRTAFSKDEWFPIPEFNGWYEINAEGDIRSWRSNLGTRLEKPRLLKPARTGRGRCELAVLLVGNDGKRARRYVHKMMADVFYGGTPKGKVAYHKDGCTTNNHVYNIGFITNKELAKMQGGKYNRRVILKVDKNGTILEVYSSMKDAAEKCYIGREQIRRHIKKILKDPFKFQDYTFRYDR